MEDVLHVKVGSRMDCMQQCPFPVQRNNPVFQLPVDRPEAADHDVLPDILGAVVALLPVITTGGNKRFIGREIRLGIADDDNREHVHLFGIKFFQRGSLHYLFLASRLPYISHGGVGRTMLQKYFLESIQLPIPPFALRVIDGRHEIGRRCRFNPFFNLLPRCHQIRQ